MQPKSLPRRYVIVNLVTIACLWVLVPPAWAVQDGDLAVGQKVDVLVKGAWRPGIIRSISRSGWGVIDFQLENGDINANTFRLAEVRPSSDQSEAVFPDTLFFSNQPVRSWTDSSGEPYFHGTLTTITGNRVAFSYERSEAGADGTSYRKREKATNLSKLSQADQEYIAQQQRFSADELAETFTSSAAKIDPPRQIRFAGRIISLQADEWAFECGPVTPLDTMAATMFVVRPPNARRRGRRFGPRGRGGATGPPDQFPPVPVGPEDPGDDAISFTSPRLDQVDLSRDGRQVVLLHTDPYTKCSSIQAIEPETGNSRTAEMKALALAIDANTRTVVRLAENPKIKRSQFALDSYNALEVISEGTGKYFYTSRETLGLPLPEKAVFVNDQILVVVSSHITAINLGDGRGYRTDDSLSVVGSVVASPDETHIAVGTTDGILVFNAVKGKPVGILQIPGAVAGHACFSPDGKRLAVTGTPELANSVAIFDLGNGKQLAQIGFTSTRPDTLVWPEHQFILVGGEELIDVENELPVWRYDSGGTIGSSLRYLGGNRFAWVTAGQGVVFSLPHNDLAAKMSQISVEDATVLRPGDSVALELGKSGFQPDQLEKIRRQLADAFATRGIRVTQHAATVLRTSVDRLARESIDVEIRGRERDKSGNRPAQKVTLTPTRSRMELVQNGNVIWKRETLNKPGSGMMGLPGETPQTTANRLCRPQTSFFRLPFGDTIVLLSESDSVLGTSKLTVSGPTDE